MSTTATVDSEAVRSRLIQRLAEVQRQQESVLRGCSGSSDLASADEVDLAASSVDFAIAAHAAGIEGAEATAIADALVRLDDGTYGICDDCGKGIAPRRLEALPYARFCIDCQRRFEFAGRREDDDTRSD